MKHKLVFLGLLLISIAQLHAQKKQGGDWHFGIKGDLNFSHINGNGMAGGYMLGAQAGGFAEYRLDNTWSIQPELLFSQNNTKKGGDFLAFYNTNGNIFAAEDIKLAYLNIPVLLKFNVNKYLSFLVGPQYGIMLKDAESLSKAGDDRAFKKSEFSANAGAQFNIGSVSLYGRYNLGLANINDIDDRYPWKSRHIQLGIAIKIK